MQLPAVLGALLLCLSPLTQALHHSDVGVVDWHKPLVGVPLSASISTAPVFHRVGGKSVILTATTNNVLAALDPEDGSIAWRYVFDHADRIAGFYTQNSTIATLSGPGGATLRTFDALSGALTLEKRLHAPELGHLSEPHSLGKAVAFSQDVGALYVLSNGYALQSIDARTGETQWGFESPDQSSLVIYSKLIPTTSALYLIGLAKSTASYTLHITSLDPSTGALIHSANVPSSIKNPLAEFTALQSPANAQDAPAPRVVWLDASTQTLHSFGLTPKLDAKPTQGKKGALYSGILDIGLGAQGQFVGVTPGGAGRVMKLDSGKENVKAVWEFKDSAASETQADSIYAGGLDSEGQPYVARVYWSHVAEKAATDIYASPTHQSLALPEGSEYIPFDSRTHGIINHVTLDLPSPSSPPRILITSSTGSLQLWRPGSLAPAWTREESLAAVLLAEFVELPERHSADAEDALGGQESFFARLQRQVHEARGFPAYIAHFIHRFATGSYASPTSSPTPSSPQSPSSAVQTPTRDTFGFRQIIVTATLFGKLYGLDSSTGVVLWSRVLGLGWAEKVGGRMQPVKMFVVRTVSDGGDPEVVCVAQRRADNTLVDTVLFHVNAVTGDDVRGASKMEDVLEGFDIISGPIVEGYLLQNETARAVLLLDEYLQVYLYPDTPLTQSLLTTLAPKISFPLRTATEGIPRIAGHQLLLNPQLSERYVAHSTWSLSLPPGEAVQTLLRAEHGPIASIGKVLGNRTTLYKYLNPRVFGVLTASPASPASLGEGGKGKCGIYLIDSAKGTIVYRAEVPSALGGACEVKAALSENWLVYHYYDDGLDGPVGGTKGYKMVTVELYEGRVVDQKIKSSDLTAYSAENTDITAYEQAYVFPHGITALAPTSTKFGITTKDLIVATKNNRIQSFARRLLNPRRPHRKTTAEEAEEFLVQYDPVLPDDPRRVLSHNYEVANVQRIVTAPALLESTSLVFTYGLDMFLTRVAPSNTFDVLSENFNKAQLVLTVSGLALAIMITKPMVQRKKLKEKWY